MINRIILLLSLILTPCVPAFAHDAAACLEDRANGRVWMMMVQDLTSETKLLIAETLTEENGFLTKVIFSPEKFGGLLIFSAAYIQPEHDFEYLSETLSRLESGGVVIECERTSYPTPAWTGSTGDLELILLELGPLPWI